MAERTFYTFTLNDGIKGLRRALEDAHITVKQIDTHTESAVFSIENDTRWGEIVLEETVAADHPLARFGRIAAVRVTTPDDWPGLDKVLILAFLRGGG